MNEPGALDERLQQFLVTFLRFKQIGPLSIKLWIMALFNFRAIPEGVGDVMFEKEFSN